MSQVAFFRKIFFEAEVEMSLRLLSFSAGWRGQVNEDSGMAVSLVDVDRWMQGAIESIRGRSWKSLESLLRFVQSEGLNPSRGSKAQLIRVEIEDPLMGEKAFWDEGKICHSKSLQIEGRLKKRNRVMCVEIITAQPFSEPEELFQFDAESSDQALQSLRELFRLNEGDSLILRDPLRNVSWS